MIFVSHYTQENITRITKKYCTVQQTSPAIKPDSYKK